MYLVFTTPFSVHVLQVNNTIIVNFNCLQGFNFIILLLVLTVCPVVYINYKLLLFVHFCNLFNAILCKQIDKLEIHLLDTHLYSFLIFADFL